jgi:hypothetical protein
MNRLLSSMTTADFTLIGSKLVAVDFPYTGWSRVRRSQSLSKQAEWIAVQNIRYFESQLRAISIAGQARLIAQLLEIETSKVKRNHNVEFAHATKQPATL